MSISASKLGALYDYLDGANYKAGLKLANSLLDKNSKSDLVKSLKAYALERTGKTEEAHQICSEILSHHPLDEDCLHPLKLVLRNLHRLQDITHLYEAAHAACPNDVGTAVDLFASYVRDGNLIKQQQLAMKLLKLSGGKEQYQWWVILSIMLQACNALTSASLSSSLTASPPSAPSPGPGALDPGKLLQLAESMASRLVARSGKLESLEGLLVYLDLLLARGQPREALTLVTGPIGGDVLRLAEERALLHADLAATCGEVREAADVLRTQLASNPEDWAALNGYLDCLLPQSAAATGPPSSSSDSPQQHQQQHQPGVLPRPCASSSLLWFTGGLAARMQAGCPACMRAQSQHLQLPDRNHKMATSSDRRAGGIEAALAEAHSTIESMLSAVGGQQQSQQQDKGRQVTMRGPHLAKVELAWRVAKLSACTDPAVAPAKWQQLAEAIMGYMQFAGQMYSCSADLRPYLPHVAGSARTWLLQQLQEMAGFPTAEQDGSAPGAGANHLVAGSESALRKRISALQVMDGLGHPAFDTEAQAVQHALQLMRLYVDAQPLYKGLDERERAPADELPPLAASVLVSAAIMAPSDAEATGHLLHALLMLEAAAATRKWSAPIRLALVALHTLLASPGGAKANMDFLSIKHVQLDTLGSHFLLPALRAYPSEPPKAAAAAGATAGGGSEPKRPSSKLLAKTCAFFSDHRKDAGETLFTAYSSGTYSKVLEFSAFKERLEASHTHLLARAETVLDTLQACLATSPQPTASAVCALVADTWDVLGFKDAAFATRSAGAKQQSAEQEWPLTLPTPPLQYTRFDEDLSTRPVWYPPVAAPVHLAPVCWWEMRGVENALQGHGLGWWAATASAESMDPQAAAWRQGSHAAACAQLHLPQLLTASLLCLAHAHEAPTSPTPTQHLARAQAATATMARVSLPSSGGDADSQLQQQQQQQQQLQQHLEHWGGAVSGPEWARLPCSQQLQRLEIVLGAAMVAVCEAMLDANKLLDPGQAAHEVHPSPVLKARIGLAQAAMSAACSKLCAMLAPQLQSNGATAEAGPTPDRSGVMVLPGAPLALAAALVHGSLTWLPVFLQACSDSLAHLQARMKKAKTSLQELEASSAALSAALLQLSQAHHHAQQQLENSLRCVQQSQQGQQESFLEKYSGEDKRQLWAWQHSQPFEVGQVLKALAQEQGNMLLGLADVCGRGKKAAKK